MNTPRDEELDSALAEVVRLFPSLSHERLRQFVEEILRWNPQLGLVSKQSPVAACRRLLIESSEFGDVVARAMARVPATPGDHAPLVADVGSGGGFPGVVWRWLHLEWDLVLIERREKKAIFLSQLVKRLGLRRMEVLAVDACDASRLEQHRAAYDVVATMAVGPPARTAPEVEDLLKPGGIFATTLPEDAAAPAECGARLVLESDTHAHFGRYALYRKRV